MMRRLRTRDAGGSDVNLHPGAEVCVVDYGSVLALVPTMAKPVKQAAGMLKARRSLTRALLAEHGRERVRGR
jgi:hypothetical protein